MGSHTLKEKVKAKVRVIKDKDGQIKVKTELGMIEARYLVLSFDFVSIIEKIIEILKKEDFDFGSFKGIELLEILKERFMHPEAHGCKRSEIDRLKEVLVTEFDFFKHTLD